MISRLENGHVAFTVDLLRLFERTLQRPLHSYGGDNSPEASTVGATLPQGDNEMRRRAFLLAAGAAALTAGQTDAAASALRPSPATLLQNRLEQVLFQPDTANLVRPSALPALLQNARRDYRGARYLDLASHLSKAIASAECAVAEHDTAENQAFLAETYNAVTRALYKLPAGGLEWITTDRALRAARQADNPMLLAETERILAVAYRRGGGYSRALQLFSGVTDSLAASGNHLKGTVAIETLCAASYTAAKGGDRERAYEFINEAALLCRHVRNDRQHWQAVDPLTNVDVYRVSIGTALHEPGTSLKAIGSVPLDALPTTERKARFLVDAAAARLAADQLDLAARTLLLAYRVAPQEVPSRATARSVARTLRQVRPDLSKSLRTTGL